MVDAQFILTFKNSIWTLLLTANPAVHVNIIYLNQVDPPSITHTKDYNKRTDGVSGITSGRSFVRGLGRVISSIIAVSVREREPNVVFDNRSISGAWKNVSQ